MKFRWPFKRRDPNHELWVLPDYHSGEQLVAFTSAIFANMAQNALWRDNVAQTKVQAMPASAVTCEMAPKSFMGG